ncbi:MAG: hypothetical protein V3T77_06820 [Planctomycetota bacterium]
MRIRTALLFTLLAASFTSGCALHSFEYAASKLGYSTTRGEITNFENFDSSAMERLADGIALKVDSDGCRITLDFGNDQHIFEVGPGCIVVFGGHEDFLLEPLVQPHPPTNQ